MHAHAHNFQFGQSVPKRFSITGLEKAFLWYSNLGPVVYISCFHIHAQRGGGACSVTLQHCFCDEQGEKWQAQQAGFFNRPGGHFRLNIQEASVCAGARK